MKPLKIGITGVRGVVGEAFTPELAVDFAQAFGTYLDGGRIVERGRIAKVLTTAEPAATPASANK